MLRSDAQDHRPTISVVVPVYNSSAYLDRVIHALESQDYDRDRYEIVMIDNNSSDGSRAIIERHPAVRLLSETKQGSYAARNTGIAAASGEIIAFTDADCVVHRNWVSTIARAMAEPTVALVLGRRLPANQSRAVGMVNDYFHARDCFIFEGDVAELYYGFTNNMAVRRRLFDAGVFVERDRGSDAMFVSSVVDRLSTAAVKYDPTIKVTHLELTSVWQVFRKVFIYGRSQKLVAGATAWRPLTTAERVEVFRLTIKAEKYSTPEAMLLFAILLTGVLWWHLGNLSARVTTALGGKTHGEDT